MVTGQENRIWLAVCSFQQNLDDFMRIRSMIYVVAKKYESTVSTGKLCKKTRQSNSVRMNVSNECDSLVQGYNSKS